MKTEQNSDRFDPWPATGTLEQRHQQLLRISKAMWALLKSRLNVSDEDLQAMLHEAAPAQPQLVACSVCRNPLQSAARCCLYCGTAPTAVNTAEMRASLSATRHSQQ